ncbi:MAG: FtsW/RodA/SpoVE family cell cycle protein [Clostridia bacterium]|nr:FtsW/RodA/SpoVE family cell cycle protein [Clostridia bacterium]
MLGRLCSVITSYIQKTDKLLWVFTIAASVYGFLLISSMQRTYDYNYLHSQIIAVAVGCVGAIIISVIDYELIERLWFIPAFISFILTIMVFFIGIRVSGTDDTAWLLLPGGMTFQPSELAKICFIITFSKHLKYLNEHDKIKTFVGSFSLLIHALIPTALIHFQGDDGSAAIFLFMALIMSFVAGTQLRYFIILFAGATASVPLIWNIILNNEHRSRILALFDMNENNLSDYAWQQYQGKVSIASGGLSGSGLYNGTRVATGIVPEQENDFIFTVAGEELGFLGCILIFLLLFAIILKSIINCGYSRDTMGKYICIGFSSLVFVQTVINIGMVLGFIPVIGITLPFFSSGGTSIMCLYFGIGLVQSVYIHREEREKMYLHIDKYSLNYR